MSCAIQRNVLKPDVLEDPLLHETIVEDQLAQRIGLAGTLQVKTAVISPMTSASDLKLP